jgi:energy-coupling factor transporter ATP-binding protein EcfA2
MSDNSAYAAAELASELRDEPSEHIRDWAGLVDDPEVVGLLNHLDTVLPEPVEETPIGKEILGNAATEGTNEAVKAGNVSKMKTATGLTTTHDDEKKLLYEAVERLANEGTIGLMFGSPGSGKTALSLDIARMWSAQTGGTVIGNTQWSGYEEVVMSDTEMLEAMASQQGPVLAVIDETAQDLSGYGEDMKPAQEFSNALTFVRKREGRHGAYAKRGSVLMISHTRTKLAKAFRDLAMFGIEKPTNNDPGRAYLFDSESGKDDFEKVMEVTGLTDTSETYDEHEASEFVIHGVDDDGEEQTSAETGPDRNEILRQEQIRMAIEAYADDPSTSYREIAESPGIEYGKDWIGDRIREYKNGEHRGLWEADSPQIDE